MLGNFRYRKSPVAGSWCRRCRGREMAILRTLNGFHKVTWRKLGLVKPASFLVIPVVAAEGKLMLGDKPTHCVYSSLPFLRTQLGSTSSAESWQGSPLSNISQCQSVAKCRSQEISGPDLQSLIGSLAAVFCNSSTSKLSRHVQCVAGCVFSSRDR